MSDGAVRRCTIHFRNRWRDGGCNPLGLLSKDAILTVAAPFCIGATGSPIIDGVVGLPGPGVFSVKTRLELADLLRLLGLPLLP
jgi:hypothetical protein